MHFDRSSSPSPSSSRRRFVAGLAASVFLAGCSRHVQASTDPRVSYYTCAMHPSVRSDDPKGKCPICGMGLVPVLKESAQAQADAPARSFTLAPEQARLLGLASAPLLLKEVTRRLRAPGQATADNAVAASFFEGDAVLLARGQTAEVRFDALPGVTLTGRVASLASASDPVSHRVETRIVLDRASQADKRLRPGFTAAVEVSVPQGRRLIAPLSAVLPTGERHVVLVDAGEGKIEPRYVVTGLALPDGWEIVSGAREGERLVTSANFLVEAQARIDGALTGWGEIR